jgi:anti-sigma factor ChrR (cupin superfamily)
MALSKSSRSDASGEQILSLAAAASSAGSAQPTGVSLDVAEPGPAVGDGDGEVGQHPWLVAGEDCVRDMRDMRRVQRGYGLGLGPITQR